MSFNWVNRVDTYRRSKALLEVTLNYNIFYCYHISTFKDFYDYVFFSSICMHSIEIILPFIFKGRSGLSISNTAMSTLLGNLGDPKPEIIRIYSGIPCESALITKCTYIFLIKKEVFIECY